MCRAPCRLNTCSEVYNSAVSRLGPSDSRSEHYELHEGAAQFGGLLFPGPHLAKNTTLHGYSLQSQSSAGSRVPIADGVACLVQGPPPTAEGDRKRQWWQVSHQQFHVILEPVKGVLIERLNSVIRTHTT